MSVAQNFPGLFGFLKELNDIGFWDFVTLALGLFLTAILYVRYKQGIPQFSLFQTYSLGNDHSLYPNTLHFEARNLMDSPIVVSRPNFRFDESLRSGNHAHGNTATGDFEIKFRPMASDGQVDSASHSYTSILLRHRDRAFAYIPFDDEMSKEDFEILLTRKPGWRTLWRQPALGYLALDVILLKETNPSVVRMNIPIKQVSEYRGVPPLGFDPAKRHGQKA